MASLDEIERTILSLAEARGPGKTICPSAAARALAGVAPAAWSRMKAGRIVIRRKGRPVDPDDFKGVYRISVPD